MFSGWTYSSNSKDDDNQGQVVSSVNSENAKLDANDNKLALPGGNPQSRLLRISSSVATTQLATLSAGAVNPNSELLPGDSNHLGFSSPVVSLSRPLSAISLLEKVPSRLPSRSQSVKDGGSLQNLQDLQRRPSSSRGSRQSLASTLTAHLFASKNTHSVGSQLSSQFQMEPESNSDSHSDGSRNLTQTSLDQFFPSPEISPNKGEPIAELGLITSEDFPDSVPQTNYGLETDEPPLLVNQFSNSFHTSSSCSPAQSSQTVEESDGYASEGELINGSAQRRIHENEDPTSPEWLGHNHQVFILSSAGKPIYTRYGDESKLTGLMGIIQAIISFFLDDKDSIRCINAGSLKIVFLLRDPLYFVLVSKNNESEKLLRDQLYCFHHQILSILTSSQLTKVFKKSNNFDLRRMLGGTEGFIDALAQRVSGVAPSYLLEAVRPVRMSMKLRQKLGKALNPPKENKVDLLYAVLASKYRLLHLLRSQKVTLHPSDLHLLLNVIHASPSFLTSHQASWIPICLPRFNRSGFLYALIKFISIDPPLALVLLSPHRDKFEDVSTSQDVIVKNLEDLNLIEELTQVVANDEYDIVDIGIPGLRHFLFKSKPLVQFTGSRFRPPYILNRERKRLFRLYQDCYRALHNPAQSLRIYFNDTEQETVVGWHTQQFELYATFTPYISKATLVQSALKLTRWVQAKREDLFITHTTLL